MPNQPPQPQQQQQQQPKTLFRFRHDDSSLLFPTNIINNNKIIYSKHGMSSFYDDFENFDNNDNENEDDNNKKESEEDMSKFRDKMNSLFSTDDDDDVTEKEELEFFEEEDDRYPGTNDDEEDEEDDDDDDDDENYSSEENTIIGSVSGPMNSVEDLIKFASSRQSDTLSTNDQTSSDKQKKEKEWASARIQYPYTDDDNNSLLLSELVDQGGVILIANPCQFCSDLDESLLLDSISRYRDNSDTTTTSETTKNNDNNPFSSFSNPFQQKQSSSSSGPNMSQLAKFGLTLPPPVELGPDRRADLLPVILLLPRNNNFNSGARGLLLNRRTGYLLGDLESQPPPPESSSPSPSSSYIPKLGAFMIQPLWFGGTSSSSDEQSSSEATSNGLDMLHLCPNVQGAKRLTDDGLFWGGDPTNAQDILSNGSIMLEGEDRILTGFDFKFFVQSTTWFPMQLEKEIRDGMWYVASVSKDVLFKSRDRLGPKRAKPLWTEIMELMGGEYEIIRNALYDE